jgi:hypothetical protein
MTRALTDKGTEGLGPLVPSPPVSESPDYGAKADHTVRSYRYRADVLEQLHVHGVRPTPTTSPELVREFLNDLYRYELRRLRDRLVRRQIPKPSYFGLVVELRNRYPLLSLKTRYWLETDPAQ